MFLVINKNIADAPKNHIICHQVNCQGVMGSGVASSIRQKFPEVYTAYQKFCVDNKNALLSKVQRVVTDDGHVVYNMFGQMFYGREAGTHYTDYTALQFCLGSIKNREPVTSTLAFPLFVGCGLGGGSWNVVYQMIETMFVKHRVVFYHI